MGTIKKPKFLRGYGEACRHRSKRLSWIGDYETACFCRCNCECVARPRSCRRSTKNKALRADILDEHALRELLEDTEAVIHLAGPPSVVASFEWPAEAVRIHAAGTAALLQACVHCHVRRVVYISSAEVYGSPEGDFVREDHPLRPRSPYAAAKIGAEKLVEAYGSSFDIETVILRPFRSTDLEGLHPLWSAAL